MMPKWEYAVIEYRTNTSSQDSTAKHMTILGGQGWELVSVDNGMAYFKRPINGPGGVAVIVNAPPADAPKYNVSVLVSNDTEDTGEV